jgi:hypothetical protein
MLLTYILQYLFIGVSYKTSFTPSKQTWKKKAIKQDHHN